MKAILGLLLFGVLSACADHAKKVDCDKHLEAINPPTPIVKPAATPKATNP